jgi:ribosomal 50S subunit-recycling heat shock protein
MTHTARTKTPSSAHDVVTLAGLARRTRIVGGSERRVFGSEPAPPQEDTMANRTTKDLSTKKTVKGGKIAVNDSLTVVRAAKPGKRDLPTKKTVKGGRITFNDNLTIVRAAKPGKKDLPSKKTVKGGRVTYNDNLTIVRAAKPGKKDLPSKKTVKGGLKIR